jgi:hypothetical protein
LAVLHKSTADENLSAVIRTELLALAGTEPMLCTMAKIVLEDLWPDALLAAESAGAKAVLDKLRFLNPS